MFIGALIGAVGFLGLALRLNAGFLTAAAFSLDLSHAASGFFSFKPLNLAFKLSTLANFNSSVKND